MERLGWVTVGVIFGASATWLAMWLANLEEEGPSRSQRNLGSGRQDMHGGASTTPATRPETGFNSPSSSETIAAKPIDPPKPNYTGVISPPPKSTAK